MPLGYEPGDYANEAKIQLFLAILQNSVACGDKVLLFSQSLFTLTLLEDVLHQQEDGPWVKGQTYLRLDGSVRSSKRNDLVRQFNENPKIRLFLISTMAGGYGINLTAANRVIIFDVCWNPAHDSQAVSRIIR